MSYQDLGGTSLEHYLELPSRQPALGEGQPALRERYRGAMLGVAAGNALGLPVEGASRQVIESLFPDGVREVAGEELNRPWDDDLAQTVILAEAILAGDVLDPTDLVSRIVHWARENGRGMGILTSQVISELAHGTTAGDAARFVAGYAALYTKQHMVHA